MDAVDARILIADDHPLFREALRLVVERVCPHAVCTDAAGYAAMVEATSGGARYDLIFLDLMMPGGDVLDELGRLRERLPSTPIVVVSAREDRATLRALEGLGIAGFIGKSEPRAAMEDAIRRVIAGERRFAGAQPPTVTAEREPLTPRQSAVLEQLVHGRSNRQIAARLGIEEITVKVHISAILRKMGVKNRLAAAVAARSVLGNYTGGDAYEPVRGSVP